ncbi:MAG: ATP-binding cassette domain-containing protein, partial [Steroidobacteraceae bacterium]
MKTDSRLRVADLTFERAGRRILDSVGVQFASGSLTAVLGPNGAGKSTLLGCMAGLLRASRGAVDLDGTPLTSLAADERARRIAFLPQIPEVSWPVDVATLVALGRIPFRHLASDAQNDAAVQRAMQTTRTT